MIRPRSQRRVSDTAAGSGVSRGREKNEQEHPSLIVAPV
jgi:hypothetical protein